MRNTVIIILLTTLAITACSDRQRNHRALERYHKGLALEDSMEAAEALRCYTAAAEETTDDSLMALAQSRMGSLFFDQGLLDKALEAYRHALSCDRRRADTLGIIYDLRDIGNVYRAGEHDDSCLVFFNEARRLAIVSGDTVMQRDVESQMAGYHLWRGDYDEARQLLMPSLKAVADEDRSGIWFMAADLYARTGQRDSAEHFYRLLLSCGTLETRQAAHRELAAMALERGDNDEALSHLRTYEQLTDSVLAVNDAEAMRKISATAERHRHEQAAARQRTFIIIAVAVIIVLLLVILSGYMYYSRKRMQFKLKLERLQQMLDRQGQQAMREAATDRRHIIEGTPIYSHVMRMAGSARLLTDEDWHILEDTVNKVYPDFSTRLRSFCRMTAHEFRVCLLLKIGLPPVAIAQLTAHTKQSVSNTRSRLYAKAFGRKGTPAEWDELVQSM